MIETQPIYYHDKIKVQTMNFIPRSMNWQGYGKSRLSNVSYPIVVDSDNIVDENKERQRKYAIRQPVSLKNYKKPLPVLIVPKKNITN